VDAEDISLIDESGEERRFRLHDAFDLADRTYYLVESVDDPEQVLLLRDAEGGLETVEGDEFDRVIEMLEQED
jgi:predicted oxidoreductase